LALIRVLIVDDAPEWRLSDGLEAIQKSQQLQPDVILLDVCLPSLNGVEAAHHICTSSTRSKIIFVSNLHCPEIMEKLFRRSSCVLGYVYKMDVADCLIPAIDAVTQEKRFVSHVSREG
jgi:DNA-binding NarL/FixJ family response regulator